MHLGIIGTGYVGLVTGVCFAEFGLNVTCVDKDRKKIASLKKGIVPFYEPGLEELLKKNLSMGRLSFSTKIADAVDSALVVFIAVGTPPRGDGSADLKYVESVAKGIAAHLNGYKVIVTKSTVPVGTGQRLRQIISKSLKGRVDFDIVSNPEFLREGAAIEDFMRPDRVIIGADSQQAVAIMKDLYRPLYLIETPFVITDVQSAELIKYASNCFLATKVSFINEMANLCEKVDADVHTVARGMGFDRRIGPKFLHPGPGFGGSCFPKDLNALHQMARNNQSPLRIVEAAVQANEAQRNLMVKKIKTAMGSLEGKKIAVLGLAFKPNTDDIRDAPSIFILNRLIEEGAKARAYDPVAMENAKAVLPKVSFSKDPYSAAKGAHALVIVTEWNEFRNLELHRIKKLLKEPYFFDLRNIYEPARMKEEGFKYFCVGRPT
jgi:UDPglucose 6-dehydrogenase